MPHFHIDCSANLEDVIDMGALCEAVRVDHFAIAAALSPKSGTVRDPDGHRIEIYCSDYQTVDPDLEPIKWDLTDPQRQTLWGAAAPRSWFEEGSAFTGVEPRDSRLGASPIIAP